MMLYRTVNAVLVGVIALLLTQCSEATIENKNAGKSTVQVPTPLSLFNLYNQTFDPKSKSPWVYGQGGFRYGLNTDGELVIENTITRNVSNRGPMFVSIGSVSPFAPKSKRTAGIMLFNYEIIIKNL